MINAREEHQVVEDKLSLNILKNLAMVWLNEAIINPQATKVMKKKKDGSFPTQQEIEESFGNWIWEDYNQKLTGES